MKIKKGQKVVVTGNSSDHGFPIGEIVSYAGKEYGQNNTTSYTFYYLDNRDFWYLKKEDFELLAPDKDKIPWMKIKNKWNALDVMDKIEIDVPDWFKSQISKYI